MFIFGDVQEERDAIGALLAAHIACEDVVVAMIAHVNGVQYGVLEGNTAKFAIVRFDGCGRRWMSGAVIAIFHLRVSVIVMWLLWCANHFLLMHKTRLVG